VVIGVAFLAVVAVSATSLYLWPNSDSSRNITTDVPLTSSGPNETREALLVGTNTSSGTFTVSWQSTGAFEVALYDAPTCESASPVCVVGTPIAHWASNESGRWGTQGHLVFPYLLVWTDRVAPAAALQAVSESTAQVSNPAPVWATLATIGALVSLGAVGVLAFFLGLFLRGGVYRRPPRDPPGSPTEPQVSRGEVEGATAPRTGSPGGAVGPPRPGPSAPGP
jgi:hypothetical protein